MIPKRYELSEQEKQDIKNIAEAFEYPEEIITYVWERTPTGEELMRMTDEEKAELDKTLDELDKEVKDLWITLQH